MRPVANELFLSCIELYYCICMYIHGSPQHRAHTHNPMCGVINSQWWSKELHIFVIIYVIILVFDGFTPPHFWTF